MSKLFPSHWIRKSLMVVFLSAVSCAYAADTRFGELGGRMICICGCNQLLGSCTMINCPASKPMKAELQTYIDEGRSDQQILAAFVDKYDKRVLSAPPTSDWFNLSAWVMPFVALFGGGALVIYFLRTWKTVTPAGTPPGVATARYEAEIEEELKKLTPED